jgi:spore maturation protein CgeB
MKDFPWIFIIEVPETAFFYKLVFLRNKCNVVSARYPYHPLIFNKFKKYFPKIKPFKLEDFKEFENLLTKVEPDLIFVFDYVRLNFNFSKYSYPKIYYSTDSHTRLNKHLKFVNFNEFDYILVAQKDYLNYYKDFGAKVFWLPYACDPLLHKGFNLPYKYDVCFIGYLPTYSLKQKLFDRAFYLKLKRGKIVKEIFNLFNAFIGNVWQFDMTRIYSQFRIILNKSLKGDLNMRVFEALASGNLLLTDKIKNGLFDLFKGRVHLVTYSSVKEAKEKINFYLEHEEERRNIEIKGKSEVLKRHTYDERVKQIRKMVGV